mmetsp:Transcript_29150/g.74945  ORF Transcript_29150/g.74945 Transcript_29150/m.74945 type:complete len:156 (+) Transcript_29150:5496-5963(+)
MGRATNLLGFESRSNVFSSAEMGSDPKEHSMKIRGYRMVVWQQCLPSLFLKPKASWLPAHGVNQVAETRGAPKPNPDHVFVRPCEPTRTRQFVLLANHGFILFQFFSSSFVSPPIHVPLHLDFRISLSRHFYASSFLLIATSPCPTFLPIPVGET